MCCSSIFRKVLNITKINLLPRKLKAYIITQKTFNAKQKSDSKFY